MRKLIAMSLLLCLTGVLFSNVGCKAEGKVDDDGVEVDIDKK